MNLVLLGANEGAFVDIGMDLDIGVIAELQSILRGEYILASFEAPRLSRETRGKIASCTYPLAIIHWHFDGI